MRICASSPMTDAARFAGIAVVGRAVRPERPEDPLLFIVNPEQLLQLTRALQPLTAKPVHKANAPGA